MTPERWQQVDKIFQLAMDLEGSPRAAFLDEACAGDPDLRREVESLLASYAQAPSFLEAPALGAAADPLKDDDRAVGRHIGLYKILRALGQGGMGMVYLAARADGEYHKQVAIKLIKRGMDTAAVVRRFRHERQMLADLEHPNIARLIDSSTTEDGRSYFIMEYVDGLPLDQYCDQHRLSVEERLTLFRTVCAAVHYAHQNLIVHRDLKPSNILVTADRVPKLLDFGIAKWLHPEPSGQTLTSTAGPRPMTPEYASPEQVRGGTITTASDVYALGAVLYELLTGQRPHRTEGHSLSEVERLICEEEPERPSAVVGRVKAAPDADGHGHSPRPPDGERSGRGGSLEGLRRRLAGDLDNIILMALRKEPARRYASVQEFSEDIRRHLEGRPVIARKDTLAYRSGKFVRRNKAAVLATGLIVLSLISGTVIATWQAHRAQQQRVRAEQQERSNRQQLYVAQMGKAYQAWENANGELVQELLEAHRPKPDQEDLRGFEWYYLWRLAHSARHTIQLANSSIGPSTTLIGLSPDGKTFTLGDTNGELKSWDVMTGEPRTLFKGHAHGPYPVALSPDGKTVAAWAPGGDGNIIELWDVPTQRKWATLRVHGTGMRSAVFSPDGQTLAAGDTSNIVTLWDVTTPQERAILKDPGKLVYHLVFSPDGKRLATGGEDYAITLWDAATGEALTTFKAHKKVIRAITFSPDSKILTSSSNNTVSSNDAYIQLWDLTARQERAAWEEKTSIVPIVYSPDSKILAWGNSDHTVKLWNTVTGQELTTLKGHSYAIRWVAFFPDGQTLASVDSGGMVKLWDVTTRQGPRTLTGHTGSVNRVAFSPDGQTLASASADATVRLWNVPTGQSRATFAKHSDGLDSLAFAPDGKTLATGSLDGTVKLWGMVTDQEPTTLPGRQGPIHAVRFSPDGRLVAAGSEDATVALWDVTTRQALPTLRGHTDIIWSVAFSPDGRTLASASQDTTVRLWDVTTYQTVATLQTAQGLARAATSVTFAPDGKTLAVGYDNGAVRLWDSATWQNVATLKPKLSWFRDEK
jgi:WD40 repeat protein/serine/threonine protein kinase